jgi:hypothetical protein
MYSCEKSIVHNVHTYERNFYSPVTEPDTFTYLLVQGDLEALQWFLLEIDHHLELLSGHVLPYHLFPPRKLLQHNEKRKCNYDTCLHIIHPMEYYYAYSSCDKRHVGYKYLH